MINSIETEYRGYRFRSRLEARWAIFFDVCGVDWEYEQQGYKFDDEEGTGKHYYLPDFILHNVTGRVNGDLYIEVKGQMNDQDAKKIKSFVKAGIDKAGLSTKTPVLIVGDVPRGNNIYEMIDCMFKAAHKDERLWPNCFNFKTIDGDDLAAYPGVNHEGEFEIFDDTMGCIDKMNKTATERAYRYARQSRFEHGENYINRR